MKNEPTSDTQLFTKIAELIETARQKVATTVNLAMVYTYFEIGRMIIEDEQQGKTRADYGKHILKDLSKRLTEKFGKGFSIENLDKMRFFYKTYAPSISSTPSTKLIQSEKETFYETASRKFILSWSHYLILMRINNSDERSFYEIECAARHWSLKQLKRNYHSSLYERLALSRDKDEIMKLATHGQIIEQPTDILKNPMTLEFLGLEEKAAYSESDKCKCTSIITTETSNSSMKNRPLAYSYAKRKMMLLWNLLCPKMPISMLRNTAFICPINNSYNKNWLNG